jgi:lysophospholipase L1-like esterase
MKSRLPVLIAIGLIVGCTLAVSIEGGVSLLGVAGLVLLGVGTVAAHVTSPGRWQRASRWLMGAGWFCACLIPARAFDSLARSPDLEGYWDAYFALTGWVMAATLLPASLPQADYLLKIHWKPPAVISGAVGATFWLAAAYLHNLRGGFYLGVPVNLAWLVLGLAWFRLPTLVIQAINTLILLLLGLPVADRFVAPPPRLDAHLELSRRGFSYAAARKDPLAFARWWECFLNEQDQLLKDLLVFNRDDFALRPNGNARLFDSRIHVNSRGFRGREIPAEKGQVYRIVALGESTTFGCTLSPNDKPWPELLEELIRERLKPSRPVEVINAGVMCYRLTDNLARLARGILPLQPDLVISYHGFNGFSFLDTSLPPVYGKPPPAYCARPSNLLAACEYRLKMLLFRRSRMPRREPGSTGPANVLDTEYAKAYRQLAEIARAKSFRLAIANYSMAVNSRSDPDVIDFYRSGFPTADWLIKANQAHSRLVQEIARQYPFVRLVDTHPGLDGRHEKFIDLIHFTQAGRQQMAETMFAAIRDILEQDLRPLAPSPATSPPQHQ